MKIYVFILFFTCFSCNLDFIHCEDKFETAFSWEYLNFTWTSSLQYKDALKRGLYIPKNNVIGGLKFYKNKFYLAMPRTREGTPATFGVISTQEGVTHNKPITPFPSWNKNKLKDCRSFQSIQSFEIDSKGIAWVLDGVRNQLMDCPPKLVLLDLNNNGRHLRTFTFPNEIGLQKGGFLNDLVIDETEGTFAYISDASSVDPGLIVYSKDENKAWKFRDGSMFQEKSAIDFKVDGFNVKNLVPIDGIALSPYNEKEEEERTVYYTALTSFSLYSISTKILKNETLVSSDQWRREIKLVGKKQSQSDGMIVDNSGYLYYTLLPLNAVGRWNINKSFDTSEILYEDKELIWPDSFAFDNSGNLYLLQDNMYKYATPTYDVSQNNGIQFRILKLQTGTKSYLSKK